MSDARPDIAAELARLLPELAVALYESAPHDVARQRTGERLTARQMRAVLHLARREPLTMSALAAGLGISRAAATEMVARLVGKGVVRREADPTDRRVVRVRLAPRARADADAALHAWSERIRGALAASPGLEPQALVAFLRTLAADAGARTGREAA